MGFWNRLFPEPAPVKEPSKPINWTALRSAAHRREPRQRVFTNPIHPPGVGPSNGKAMAMDQNVSACQDWAAGGLNAYELNSFFLEGLTFLGYPFLAELAQRPEYRVISETKATEMTRRWIRFTSKGDKDKTDKINEVEDEFKRLNVQDMFCRAIQQDGFFGRGHIYVDTGDTDNPDELTKSIGDGWDKLSSSKLSKKPIEALRTVEAVWCYPTSYNSNDPLKDDWYRPNNWYVQSKIIHSSRLLTFIGREVPDLLKPTYSFGGLSLSQMAKPYVDNWLKTRQSVNDAISAFTTWVLSTNLQVRVQADGEQLMQRAEVFANIKRNAGLMMLDKDTEEFQNVSFSLGSLDKLQAQAQEHMCTVAHTPTVKLLGIQPAGLNADSEGIMRSYYDWIHACQEHEFRDKIRRLMGIVELGLWGDVDEDIDFEFEPLFALTEKEAGEVRKLDAETGQIHIDSGVLSPEEERKRVAEDPDTLYPGLDIEDVPESPLEQQAELGLNVQQGNKPGGPGAGMAKGPQSMGAKPPDGAKASGSMGQKKAPQNEIHIHNHPTGKAMDAKSGSKTFWLIRHGATKYNNSTDESADRIRGWMDIPLSKEGVQEADKLADGLKNSGITRIFTSDLSRAEETAEAIAESLEIDYVPTMNLRPWNLGKFAGQSTKDALPEIAEYVRNKPDEKVPEGESFNSFKKRAFEGLSMVVKSADSNVAMVTHHRIERLLKAWVKKGCPPDHSIDMGTFLSKGEDPGHSERVAVKM